MEAIINNMRHKVSDGKVWRYSDSEKDFVLSSKTVDYFLKETKYKIFDRINKNQTNPKPKKQERKQPQPVSIKYNGGHYSVRELFNMSECNVSLTILKNRLAKGWDIEEAMSRLKYGSGRSATSSPLT